MGLFLSSLSVSLSNESLSLRLDEVILRIKRSKEVQSTDKLSLADWFKIWKIHSFNPILTIASDTYTIVLSVDIDGYILVYCRNTFNWVPILVSSVLEYVRGWMLKSFSTCADQLIRLMLAMLSVDVGKTQMEQLYWEKWMDQTQIEPVEMKTQFQRNWKLSRSLAQSVQSELSSRL